MKLLDKAKLKQNIQEIAKYDLENQNLFGSSYFVSQNGTEILKEHFGVTGLDEAQKVDDGTIFRLASMTKPITAAAILILVDRGLVSLDDPVSKFFPEFNDIHVITKDGVDLGKTKTPVTILHCLTHTSGFGSNEKPVEVTDADRGSYLKTIRCFVRAGLDFEPFTMQSYSAYAAFDVLAAIVEKVTKQDYEEFLKKEIFIPCDMRDTTFLPSEEQWKRVITMHKKTDDKNDVAVTYPNCIFGQIPCGQKLAGAGLVSTLHDYANFAQMLLNEGNVRGQQIVSPETLRKISQQYLPEEFAFGEGTENWGLGVRVILNESYGTLSVGSYGWSGAYGAHFWIDVENQICAVFMKNSHFDGGAANQSAQRFEKAVYDALIS